MYTLILVYSYTLLQEVHEVEIDRQDGHHEGDEDSDEPYELAAQAGLVEVPQAVQGRLLAVQSTWQGQKQYKDRNVSDFYGIAWFVVLKFIFY